MWGDLQTRGWVVFPLNVFGVSKGVLCVEPRESPSFAFETFQICVCGGGRLTSFLDAP